jgi:hypothetical protein
MRTDQLSPDEIAPLTDVTWIDPRHLHQPRTKAVAGAGLRRPPTALPRLHAPATSRAACITAFWELTLTLGSLPSAAQSLEHDRVRPAENSGTRGPRRHLSRGARPRIPRRHLRSVTVETKRPLLGVERFVERVR